MNEQKNFTLKRLSNSYLNKNITILNSIEEFKIIESKGQNKYNIDFRNVIEGDFNDYIIIKYGADNSNKEFSIFKSIKGGQSPNQKSDVSFIIYNKLTEKVSLIIGEIKDTINSGKFNKARKQIVATLLDALMLNSLFTLDKLPSKIALLIFYINDQGIIITKTPKNSNTKVMESTRKQEFVEGRRFTNYEWTRKKIVYSIENFNKVDFDKIDEFFSNVIEKEIDLICCKCQLNGEFFEPVNRLTLSI